jgi:hypothetical protein
MKITILLFMCLGAGYILKAQQTPAENLANHIAQKMKDSLALSEVQKNQIYTLNMQLSNLKTAARQQYTGTDSLGRGLQRIENTRDSLYSTVLTEQQMLLYRQKKRNLVSKN